MENNYIKTHIQKGFTPGMSWTFEHTAHVAHFIRQEKRNQRSLVVMLLDLRNSFGEIHHNLIPVALAHHHILNNIIKLLCQFTSILHQQSPLIHSQLHSFTLRRVYYKAIV